MSNEPSWSGQTIAAQALHGIDEQTGAVAPPIHPTSTFARGSDHELMGAHFYSRYGSPTLDHAEAIIAQLEGAAGCLLFASGLAAIAAILETVPAGRHIAAPQIMYFGAQLWLKRIAKERAIALTFYDQTDPDALGVALRPGETALVWVECPTNPTWDMTDLAAAAGHAHRCGALLGVDSTGAPPCTTRPLDYGADIVMHSATKYLNGHSDLTAGAVSLRSPEQLAALKQIRTYSGGVLGAFEAWLLIRGMRTLHVRFRQQSETALRFARHFAQHPKVERVLYPGLEYHPGHAIARRQMGDGFGGMLSVLVRGAEDLAKKVSLRTKLFVSATSLGGVESLIEHRRSIEGPDSPVPANLLRISIGLESGDDLIADFEQALI